MKLVSTQCQPSDHCQTFTISGGGKKRDQRLEPEGALLKLLRGPGVYLTEGFGARERNFRFHPKYTEKPLKGI